jgi:hypothetical protein
MGLSVGTALSVGCLLIFHVAARLFFHTQMRQPGDSSLLHPTAQQQPHRNDHRGGPEARAK